MKLRNKLFFGLLLLASSSISFAAEDLDELINHSKKQEEVMIVHVNATDIVTLEDGRRIRLIGIESAGAIKPKYVSRDQNGAIIEEKVEPNISLEEQALAYAQSLMEGKKVRLEFDVQARGDDGKNQAYLFLSDGTMANAELLRQGLVNLRIRPPNVKYAQMLREAYQEAKQQQRGYLGS